MTEEELKDKIEDIDPEQILKDMEAYFGRQLPNPEHEPKSFQHLMKLYKYNVYDKKNLGLSTAIKNTDGVGCEGRESVCTSHGA